MGRISIISLFAICLLSSVGISTWLQPDVKKTESAPDAQFQEQIDGLSRRFEQFEDRLTNVAASVMARSASTSSDAQIPKAETPQTPSSAPEAIVPEPAQAFEEPDLTPPDDPYAQSEDRRDYRWQIDQVIAHQGINPELTQTFWDTVITTVEEYVEVDANVEELSCSNSFCRLVVHHEDRTSQSQFLDQIQGQPGFQDEGIAHLEEDGTTFIYLVLDGGGFPERAL